MFSSKMSCLLAVMAVASTSHSAPSTTTPSPADVINGYYDNYRRMDEARLQSELLVLWMSTVGDADFDLKEQIGADCKKVATAAADVWQDLPMVELAAPLVDRAVRELIADLRAANASTTTTTPIQHPMEKMCQHLERALQLEPVVNTKFLRFQRQPKSTPPELAKNAKQIVGHATIVVNDFYVTLLSAARVGQLVAHGMFLAYVRSNNCAIVDYRLAKAIIELSKNAELQTSVQYAYEKGLYDAVQFALEILDRDKNNAIVPVFQIITNALMARVKENFEKDTKLRTELENKLKVIGSTVCKSTT